MPRVTEIMEDEDEDEEKYWDTFDDDNFWLEASNHPSVNNSPVKEDVPAEQAVTTPPETPVSSRMAKDLGKMNIQSGGARLPYDTPTKIRSSSVASTSNGQSSFPQAYNYSASIEESRGRPEEPSPSRLSSSSIYRSEYSASRTLASSSKSQSEYMTKSRLRVSPPPMRNSERNQVNTRVFPTSSVGAPTPQKSTPPPTRLPYDTDIEMDSDEEVEYMVDTDTESSVAASTRQNSLFSVTADSRTTSTSSIWSEEAGPLGAASQKHGIPYQTPTKRQTMQTPQRTMGSPPIVRAVTYPNSTSQRPHPPLAGGNPIDEESVFRPPPPKPVSSTELDTLQNIAVPPIWPPWPPKSSSSVPTSSKSTTTPSIPRPTPSKPSTLPSSSKVSSIPSSTHSTQPPERSNTVPSVEPQSEPLISTAFLEKIAQASQYFLIAHDQAVQSQIERRHLSWGVQYEIARGVSKGMWQWADVTDEKLNQLRGSNVDAAPSVVDIMLDRKNSNQGVVNKEHWRELDRELEATLEGKGRGLGLMGEWKGKPNWYGGQVQQIARITHFTRPHGDSRPPYDITIEPLEQRKSSRIPRLLGSVGALQLRVPKDMMHGEASENLQKFLHQKFVICGRVFLPYHAKEGKVYMMQSNEDYQRRSQKYCGDQFRMSLAEFVGWHNPLPLNYKQPISKWATRWALGLSTSVPVLEFDIHNIEYIPDINAPHDQEGKIPAEKVMTDGCGLINGAALYIITQRMGYPHRPTAVQGRIAGSKGLWMLHPHHQSPEEQPRIWIRDSQKKINHGPNDDPLRPSNRALLIFDLLTPSRVTVPTRLSMLSINNLSHNGVPNHVFESLIKKDLEEEVAPLTRWKDSMLPVAKAISNAGRITGSRLQRFAGGMSRAHGFIRDFHRDEEGDDSAAPDLPICAGREPYSGAPIALHECTYELLAAGFNPLNSIVVADKIHSILKLVIESYVKSFKIAVSESIEAFILPDPCDILEEGEIYFRSSQQNLVDPSTGALFNTLKGPVVVGRNPVRLPSDLQKVMAIGECPELSNYYDVVIFSTKGSRSLASLLAGGDYDGDTVFVIWLKDIVDHFQNSPFSDSPPNFLDQHFRQKKESIISFCDRVGPLQPTEVQAEFQGALLLGLVDSRVGRYSILHDTSVYMHGYSHEQTIRLAYMVMTCLDSSKTGLLLKENVFNEDMRLFKSRRVACMVEEGVTSTQNLALYYDTDRPAHLGSFALDALVRFGKITSNEHLRKFDEMKCRVSKQLDSDLERPLKEAARSASQASEQGFQGLDRELNEITSHVDAAYRCWMAAARSSSESQASSPAKSPTKKQKTDKSSSEQWREASRRYSEGPSLKDSGRFITADIDAIKASYAYKLSPKFATSVAFKHICAIKAKASRDLPTTQEFAEAMSIGSSFVRALGYDESAYV